MEIETTPIEFVLTYGSSPVGLKLHALEAPTLRLVTPPKEIHPFWHKTAIVDNRYPAPVFEHNFLVTLDGTDAVGYVASLYAFDVFWDRASESATQSKTLNITTTDSTVMLTFGLCNFAGFNQSEPGQILINKFGLVGVKFLGTTRPVRI